MQFTIYEDEIGGELIGFPTLAELIEEQSEENKIDSQKEEQGN